MVADTHAHCLSELPTSLINTLTQMDMVIHLGDFSSESMVNDLKAITNFRGVAGNHDNCICGLPEKEVISVKDKRIGLIHGHGCIFPFGFKWGLLSQFETRVDAILYGHTHSARNTVAGGVLFFNPGSVVGRFPAMRRSYGVLTVGDEISSEIITLEAKKYYYFNKCVNLASKTISFCYGLNKGADRCI